MIESKTVLVVEDERIVAEDISEILRSMGCFVCGIAATGQDAVDLALEFKPDLILMDIVLQGDMDGIEASREIRKTLDVPITFLTAYSDRGVIDRAKEVGPTGYIIKPFDDDNLRSTVEITLHKAQVEKTLAQSKDWLITGLRSISDGVIAVDRMGQVEFMNKAAEDMVGTSSMSAYGIDLLKLNAFFELDRTMLTESPVKRILDGGHAASEHMEFLCRNRTKNTSFPVECSAASIRDDDNDSLGAVFIFRDITSRKRAETLQEEHRTKLEQTVAERTADLQTAYDNIVREVGERKSIQYKLNSQIAMERLAVEISTQFLAQNDASQADAISSNLSKVRQHLDFDFACIVEVNPRGGISMEYLSCRPDYVKSGINQMSGTSLPQPFHKGAQNDCYEWGAGRVGAGLRGEFDDFLKSKGVHAVLFVPMNYSLQRRMMLLGTFDGRSLETESVQASLMMIGHIFSSAFDRLHNEIERKSLQAQLVQAQKMEAIGKLSGGIAHDFNNLLVPILGYAEMLLGEKDEADDTREDLEEIRKAAESASMLTRQMLAFSRKQILSKSVWDLAELLEHTGKLLSSVIGENIEMTIQYAPDVYCVLADQGQIQQVFMNLCVNARDAMPDGGRLDIEMSHIDDEVLVSVRDTGSGIPADKLEQIFEPFYSTKGSNGTGLGLSVVYGIIQQHNGVIQVTSQEGKGTSFFIKLPMANPEELRRLSSSPEMVAQFDGANRTILLVEDEAGVLRFMQHALEDKNYEVRTANTLHQARELFDAIGSDIDVILTDAVLPDGNGVELIEYALQKRSDVATILCSGYTDKQSLMDHVPERGITFLQKPFSIQNLYRTVYDVISGQAMPTLD